MAGVPPRRGRVTAFDEAGGYGTVEDTDGTSLFFHCTAIADGTRTIEVDTKVDFEPRPARHGGYEAGEVTPRS